MNRIISTRAFSTISSRSSALSKHFKNEKSSQLLSRLDGQYSFSKGVFDYPQLVPPQVKTSHISKVIDAAAGTGAWAHDFASLPNVRDRDVQIFACDITTANFRRVDRPAARKINFFQQDVTKPFPNEMLGTFDLANMNYLFYDLTAQGWKTALQNLHDLLKPGGHLILRDFDAILHSHENPPLSIIPQFEEKKPDIMAHMQGTSTLAKMNRIFTGIALHQNFIVDLSYQLPKMLEEASLKVLSSKRVLVPFGACCDLYTSVNGSSLSHSKEFSIENVSQVANMTTLIVTKEDELKLASGVKMTKEEERQNLIKEFGEFAAEKGMVMTASEWVIVRP
ncbi:S-adenosyl-L-methionine-dependent methyltransferase [Multifurca ochricompacta]|uniref:S-adenosyl-L-methionine-dependent methyltransferase n=1 Tax=Multifurca ochricompacta TaxID=376703 RepID=A0AAD4LUP7_9AGAM|nr:S-adenosyl-L-methionine-dependent methyltransferase [Multifurca ochricompacta]